MNDDDCYDETVVPLEPCCWRLRWSASAQNHPSHQITNGEITATVYLPDAKNGFYTTTRFDWSGAIGSLKYKGHDYYGIWWSKVTDIYDFGYEGPNKDVISADFTAMVGPAEEFGALGYNDVPAGGLFVKPGVGVLKRDEMNYNHSRPYVIANGGKWDVKTSRDAVEFTHTLSEPSINFGYVYTKVVRLTPGKPQMTISHVMRNTGSKPIVTNVYNHNFTTIDKLHTGTRRRDHRAVADDAGRRARWCRAAGRGPRCASGQPAVKVNRRLIRTRRWLPANAWARSAVKRRCNHSPARKATSSCTRKCSKAPSATRPASPALARTPGTTISASKTRGRVRAFTSREIGH